MPPDGSQPPRNSDGHRDRRFRIAGFRVAKRAMQWTAAGVVVTTATIVIPILFSAIVITILSRLPGGQSGTQSGGNITGNNNDNNVFKNYQIFQEGLSSDANAEQVRQRAKRFSNVKPVPPGPWPFSVIDVGDLGLKIRSSGTKGGQQIGSAAENTAVWADCVLLTDFTPPAENMVGPRWIRIRWPNNVPTRAYFTSEPSNPFEGWAYAGNLVPAGHNGEIPSCDQ